MAIEKISVSQSVKIAPKVVFKGKNEEQTEQRLSESKKDVVTVLSVLAAIGAAGVAIYKHKDAKDAIKKAEEEAKKKVKEAEEKAKKAAEDADKKIQEAVDKAKKEFEDKKTPKTPDAPISNETPKSADDRKTKKTKATKPATSTSGTVETHKPSTGLKTNAESKPDVTVDSKEKKGIAKKIIGILEDVKGKLKRTHKEEKPKDKPKPIKRIETTEKTSKIENLKKQIFYFAAETKNYTIEKWNKFLELFQTKRVIAEDKSVDRFFDDGAQKGLEYLEKQEKELKEYKNISDIENNYWVSTQHEKKQKEYQELFDKHFEEQGKDIKKSISEQLNEKTDFAKFANSLITEPHTQAEHDAIQAMYDEMAIKQTYVLEDYTKISENDLLNEYNNLLNTVKGLSAMDPLAQKFLKLQGELLNHRGYRFKNGKLIKNTELREELEQTWKDNVKDIVSDKEKQLNGNISVSVPNKPSNYEHAKLQAEYDKLSIMPEKTRNIHKSSDELKEQIEQSWKDNVKDIVSDKEKQLNGNISVSVPNKPTETEHNEFQKQLEKVFGIQKQKEKVISSTPKVSVSQKKEEPKKLINGQLTINPIRTYEDTDEGLVVTRNVVNGLNDQPQSFNEQERKMIKYVYGGKKQKDDVTKYPKLYSTPKEEKAMKKAYEKAKKEHISRRVDTYSRHSSTSDIETAIHSTYMIIDDMKFSTRKYKAMAKERPTAQDWKVDMTREEFMKNKERYMQENFEAERRTNGIHNFTNAKKQETVLDKVKSFFGF